MFKILQLTPNGRKSYQQTVQWSWFTMINSQNAIFLTSLLDKTVLLRCVASRRVIWFRFYYGLDRMTASAARWQWLNRCNEFALEVVWNAWAIGLQTGAGVTGERGSVLVLDTLQDLDGYMLHCELQDIRHKKLLELLYGDNVLHLHMMFDITTR